MKINKKLSAAITLSLMLGVYGSASAHTLYGCDHDNDVEESIIPQTLVERDVNHGVAIDQYYAINKEAAYIIKSGTFEKVYGGHYTTTVDYVENNVVGIKGVSTAPVVVEGDIVGGLAKATSNNNKVGTEDEAATNFTAASVYGGKGATGAASNEVNLGAGVTVTKNVYGGYTTSGTAGGTEEGQGNVVSINCGTDSAKLKIGTYNAEGKITAGGYVIGGYAENGAANGNKVGFMNGTTFVAATNFTAGYVNGGYGKTAAVGNEVNLGIGAKVLNYVFGGYVSDEGNAVGNNVKLEEGAEVNGSVVGGWTKKGTEGGTEAAKGNKVIISGGTVGSDDPGNVYGGFVKEQGDAIANEVSIADGTITGKVYGGWTKSGTAGYSKDSDGNIVGEGNIVSIAGADAEHKVLIGTYTGGTITAGGNVYGGYSANGAANGNKVGTSTQAATNFTAANVYGGKGTTGAEGNEVWLGAGADVTGVVNGGVTIKGDATNNIVNITGGTIDDEVIGGAAMEYNTTEHKFEGEGNATSNTVTVTNATIGKAGAGGVVYGGRALKGNASSNSVTIESGTIGSIDTSFGMFSEMGGVIGGATQVGDANNNTVTINGGTIGADIPKDMGGIAVGDIAGGSSNNTGDAKENTVIINGGVIYKDVLGGAASAGNADSNTVTITGGKLNNNSVYGGKSWDGSASKNTVNISGTADTSATDVYGGKGTSAGTGNTLNIDTWSGKAMKSINDFQVINVKNTREIDVGNADGLKAGAVVLTITDEALDMNTLAKGTEIVYMTKTAGSDDFSDKFTSESKLNGSKVNEGVWRAKKTGFGVDASKAEFQIDATKAFVSVTEELLAETLVDNNGNTISEELVLDDRAAAYENIYGVYNAKKEAMAATVNMNTAADLSKSTIWGNNVSAAGNTLNVKATGIKVKGLKNFGNMNFYIPATAKAGDTMVEVGSDVNLAGVKVAAGFHNDTKLVYGDKVKLINAPKVSGMDGVSEQKVDDTDYTKYDVNIYQADAGMNQVASGATSLVAELVNSELTENAKSLVETRIAAAALLEEGSDMLASASFANAESALRADVEQGAPAGSISIFGAVNGNKSRLKSGSYVDAKGWNFNMGAAKEFVNKSGKLIFAPVVEYGRGSYDSYLNNGYHGEGKTKYVGGGLMAKQSNKGGSYFEGSVRAGKLSADYEATGGNYDSDSMYLAAHLGLGKVVKLSEKNSLDYYGKYFYSRQGSDDTILNASGKTMDLHFDAVESHRTRLGGRFNHALGETNTIYAGLAWQHEFSSTARATLDGMGTPSPSAKGDTGILELGVKVSENNKYDLDFGVNGSVGKKKGAGLSLNFNWKF